jgi:hypothetical protein
MSDALSDVLGNPGEPVAEVHPDDLKTYWQETRSLQARYPDRNVSVGLVAMKTSLPSANIPAVWYRTSMILVLNLFAQEQLAPWVKDEEVSDAVFRTMATIPMEWIGHTDREGLPFDVEEFFRRLKEGTAQNG